MANRIYIAAGMLAIVLMLAAFVLPRFWPWDSYKPNLEAMASEALGVEVTIPGALDFTLLPRPRLIVGAVELSGPNGRIGTASGIEADFSLMDFLRDRFAVTRLLVLEPNLMLTVDQDGVVDLPFDLAEDAGESNVSIASAEFSGGRVQLYDQRSEQAVTLDAISGQMEVTALRGPFVFEGSVGYDGARYALEIVTTALNPEGVLRVTGMARPTAGGFSLQTDGLLTTGMRPSFIGDFSYRQAPPAVIGDEENAETAQGDLLFESQVEAGLERVLFSEIVLLPDENQVATRLTGAGEIDLGRDPQFSLRANGGVVTLVPPDLTLEGESGPYELVSLLEGLPTPPIPPLPGRVELSVTELGLSSVRLRDLTLDASIADGEWDIATLTAGLPGATQVSLTGALGQAAGWPILSGRLTIDSQSLDGLAGLWTRPPDGNPLFGQAGRLETEVRLGVETVELRRGVLNVGGVDHALDLSIDLGDQRTLAISAGLGALDASGSAALLGLLPQGDGLATFLQTFPQGRFGLAAEQATIDGQVLADASFAGLWGPEGITFDTLAVGDYGGLGLQGAGALSGTLAAPHLAFTGDLVLAEEAPILAGLIETGGGGAALARMIAGHLPADLAVSVSQPESGAQSVAFEGTAGALELVFDADLDQGLLAMLDAPLRFDLSASAETAEPIFAQFGMAPLIAGTEGALLTASGRGIPGQSLDTDLRVEGGGERLGFAGTLMFDDDEEVRGQGQASFLFADMGAVMELAGAPGLYVPPLEGEAELGFLGSESVTLSGLTGFSGESTFGGALTYSAQSGGGLLSGEIVVDQVSIETLAAMAAGPVSLLQSADSLWPDGPLDVGSAQRPTRGRVLFTVPDLTVNGETLVADAGFEFGWDPQEIRIRDLRGAIAGGSVGFEAVLCCASDLASKSVSGLFSLTGVDLPAVLPEVPGEVLNGQLTASARFQGNGDSFAGFFGSLTGEGSFSVADMVIERLSPDAFASAAETDDLIEIAPAALEVQVIDALDSGPFIAGDVAGVVSLAGGDIRITNLAIDGEDARLLGNATLDLRSLALSAGWTLATTETLGGNGLITETTGRIGVGLEGPLWAPERALDLSQMVDAIQMRAYEIELDELERLRAEDEARRQAAVEEQARLLEEESRRQAEALLEQQSEDIQQQIADDLAEQEAAADDEGEEEGEIEEDSPQVFDAPLGLDPDNNSGFMSVP